MEVHPFFDIETCEWVIEIDGCEVVAKRLSELQAKLPGIKIKDYAPEGYVAERTGFLEPVMSKRVVSYKSPAHKARVFVEHPKKAEVAQTPVAPPKVEPPEKPRAFYDLVMDMVAKGYRSPTIAAKLKSELAEVQLARLMAYRSKDPRAQPRPRRFMRAPGSIKQWGEDDDNMLRYYVSQRYTAAQIGAQMGRTSNSIIGRCHRQKIQLMSK